MSERAGAFLCFYNFAKLQFSEIQGALQCFTRLQVDYVIMPHFKRSFLQLTNKMLYRKGQADVAAKAAE